MKPIFFKSIILIVYWFSQPVVQAQLNDFWPFSPLEKKNLQEEVNKISQHNIAAKIHHVYHTENGNTTTKSNVDEIVKYKRDGRIDEIRYLKANQGLRYITRYLYDNNGNNIARKTYTPEGDVVGEVLLTYNEAQLLVMRKEIHSEFGVNDSVSYQFNADKQTAVAKFFDESRMLQSIYRYEYVNNRLWMIEKKTSNGRILFRTSFIYENEQLTKKEFHNAQGQLLYYIELVYDEKNYLQQEIKKNSRHLTLSRFHYNYSNQGLLTGYIKYGPSNNTLEYYKISYEFF